MAKIGTVLFGLIFIAGAIKIVAELLDESKDIYRYTSGYIRDLILSECIIVYALVFSIVVIVKTRKK